MQIDLQHGPPLVDWRSCHGSRNIPKPFDTGEGFARYELIPIYPNIIGGIPLVLAASASRMFQPRPPNFLEERDFQEVTAATILTSDLPLKPNVAALSPFGNVQR